MRRANSMRDLVRKVQADCAIDLDKNSYSVPWRLIGEGVQVVVLGGRVYRRHAGEVVADHASCRGRRQRIVERAHLPAWSALLRRHDRPGSVAATGRL